MNKVIPVGTKVFVFSYDGGPSDDLKDYEFEIGTVIDNTNVDKFGEPFYTVSYDDDGELMASNSLVYGSVSIGFIRTFEQYINYLSLKIANNYQIIGRLNKENVNINNFINALKHQYFNKNNDSEYFSTNGSVKIAEKLSEFSCDLSKTEEVIKKYQDLIKKDVSSSKVLRNKNNRN